MAEDDQAGSSKKPASRIGARVQLAREDMAETYRTLLETSPDAMIITDLSGRITWVNAATAAIYGARDPEWFIGRSAEEVLAPEDRRTAQETMRLMAEDGLPTRLEYRIQRPDGSCLYASAHMALSRNVAGEPSGFVATVRDVSDQHASAEGLRQSRQMLTQVLDSIPVAVLWKDRESVYLGGNKKFARDAGCETPEDLVGKTDFDLSFRDQASRYRADDREVIESGVPKLGYEEPLMDSESALHWIRTSKVPLRDPRGAINGVLVTYEDITPQRESALELERRNRALLKANQELERLHRVKDEFVAMVSHELRTPLVTGIGYLELLLDGRFGEMPDKAQERLRIAHRNLMRLSSIIQNLLSYQSVIQPGADLGLSPVDLRPVLNDCVSEFRVRHKEAAARLETDFASKLPPVLADVELIRVVVANLLDNAARHAGENASFRLVARRREDGVEIGVEDSGRGMEPEIMSRAFEPFVKSTDQHGGSGLGLAIVQGILSAHDARVSLQSAPDQGTAIRFVLPEAEGEAPPRPRAEKALTPVVGVPATARIAVVEDDADTREFLRLALLKQGYTVVEAASAEEALRNIDFGEVDLCLLDYSLPGLDGTALCRQLLAAPALACLPVLMVTAHAEDAARDEAEAAGCVGYLLKPLSLDTFLHTVRKALGHVR